MTSILALVEKIPCLILPIHMSAWKLGAKWLDNSKSLVRSILVVWVPLMMINTGMVILLERPYRTTQELVLGYSISVLGVFCLLDAQHDLIIIAGCLGVIYVLYGIYGGLRHEKYYRAARSRYVDQGTQTYGDNGNMNHFGVAVGSGGGLRDHTYFKTDKVDGRSIVDYGDSSTLGNHRSEYGSSSAGASASSSDNSMSASNSWSDQFGQGGLSSKMFTEKHQSMIRGGYTGTTAGGPTGGPGTTSALSGAAATATAMPGFYYYVSPRKGVYMTGGDVFEHELDSLDEVNEDMISSSSIDSLGNNFAATRVLPFTSCDSDLDDRSLRFGNKLARMVKQLDGHKGLHFLKKSKR